MWGQSSKLLPFIVNSSVSLIPMCTAVSRSDELNPEHLQSKLSGHVTDRYSQWADWWLASACQPYECSASYRMAQRWSRSALVTHNAQATSHVLLPLPCIFRNVVWYYAKYSSLKSLYVLQSHPASIPSNKMKFCGSDVWVRWQQIEKCIWYFAGFSQVFIFKKSAKPGAWVDILYVQKSIKTAESLNLK